MSWKRVGNAKPGVPAIPSRADLEARNRPARLAAEAKAAKATGDRKKGKKK